jgi:superfamily II DNA or RNA helicase
VAEVVEGDEDEDEDDEDSVNGDKTEPAKKTDFSCGLCSLQKFDRLLVCQGCGEEGKNNGQGGEEGGTSARMSACKAQCHLQCFRKQQSTDTETSAFDPEDWTKDEAALPKYTCVTCQAGSGPVAAITDMPNHKGATKEYVELLLIKWVSLGYSECTWEFPEELQSSEVKVGEFRQWQNLLAEEAKVVAAAVGKGAARKGRQKKGGGKAVEERREGILPRKSGTLTQEQIPVKNAELRDYQVEGISWMVFQWVQRRSCILADEMGLGKTIQSMCLMNTVRQFRGGSIVGLVVAPLSTLRHWQIEIEMYTGMTSALLYGNIEDREKFKEMEVETRPGGALRPKFHVLLTSYESAVAEIGWLQKFNFDVAIWDEGHRMKNHLAQTYKTLSKINIDFNVLLSGTPIQNNTGEIFSLLSFTQPNDFTDRQGFMDKYEEISTEKQVLGLQSLLRKYMLRREKRDVALNIPRKTETILNVEMTIQQKQFYKAILERNRKFLGRGSRGDKKELPQLVNILQELRKVCNHPYIVKGSRLAIEQEHKEEERLRKKKESKNFKKEDVMVQCSGKIVLLMKFIPKVIKEGNKMLIFSQFTKTLDLIEEFLDKYKHKYCRIDGSTPGKMRGRILRNFNNPVNGIDIFLLTTRAGGLGLNLQAANTVVIFDSDWNPQHDIQAMSRSHRLGQKKEVKIYRLLTRNTIEEHIFSTANKKLGLTNVLLNGLAGTVTGKTASEKKDNMRDVDDILKNGAYEFLTEDDDAAREKSKKFMEGDIEDILKDSAKEVIFTDSGYKDANKVDESEENGRKSKSAFAQVTFVGQGDESLNVNDEDFWEKALPGTGARIPTLQVSFESDEKVKELKEDEELRNMLLKRVTRVAEEINAERVAGETPDETDAIVVLLQVVVSANVYTEEQNAVFDELRNSILKPKRKRKTINYARDGMMATDGNDSDFEGRITREEGDAQKERDAAAIRKARRRAAIPALRARQPPVINHQPFDGPPREILSVTPWQIYTRTHRTLWFLENLEGTTKDFAEHSQKMWTLLSEGQRNMWNRLAVEVNGRAKIMNLDVNYGVERFNELLSLGAIRGREILELQDSNNPTNEDYIKWIRAGKSDPLPHVHVKLDRMRKNNQEAQEQQVQQYRDHAKPSPGHEQLPQQPVDAVAIRMSRAKAEFAKEPKPELKYVRNQFFVDFFAILPLDGAMGLTIKTDSKGWTYVTSKVMPHPNMVSCVPGLEDDLLIAVNGTNVVNRQLKDVIQVLRTKPFPKVMIIRRVFSSPHEAVNAAYVDCSRVRAMMRAARDAHLAKDADASGGGDGGTGGSAAVAFDLA